MDYVPQTQEGISEQAHSFNQKIGIFWYCNHSCHDVFLDHITIDKTPTGNHGHYSKKNAEKNHWLETYRWWKLARHYGTYETTSPTCKRCIWLPIIERQIGLLSMEIYRSFNQCSNIIMGKTNFENKSYADERSRIWFNRISKQRTTTWQMGWFNSKILPSQMASTTQNALDRYFRSQHHAQSGRIIHAIRMWDDNIESKTSCRHGSLHQPF